MYIINGTIYTMDKNNTVIERGAIRVKDGILCEVGRLTEQGTRQSLSCSRKYISGQDNVWDGAGDKAQISGQGSVQDGADVREQVIGQSNAQDGADNRAQDPNRKTETAYVSLIPEDGEEIIDAKGGLIFPGFIEAHCHIGIQEEKKGMEGNDCNEAVNPMTPWLRAEDAVNPMDAAFKDAVRAGITCVQVGPGSSNVVGGQHVVMKTFGRRVDDMLVKAPSAMKVAFGENPKVNYSGMNQSPVTRMAIAGLLRQELFEAQAYCNKRRKVLEEAVNRQEDGNTEKNNRKKAGQAEKLDLNNGEEDISANSISVNSLQSTDFEKDFTKECWVPVFEGKIPLKAHVHRADDIFTAIRIAKEFGLNMTLDHCSEGHLIAEELAESGFPAIVGPDFASRNKIEVQNMAFKTAGILYEAGVPVAITTDHPVSLIQSLPLCAGLAVKAGLPFMAGLRAITIEAARIAGVADRLGSLEVKKDADICIFTRNPMEILSETLYTIIDGKIVYRRDDHFKGNTQDCGKQIVEATAKIDYEE